MKRTVLLSLFCFLMFFPNAGSAKVYIDVGSPVFRPFPIGVLGFKDASGASGNASQSINEIFLNDLTISGFFEIINPANLPEGPINEPPSDADYQKWSKTGAEALVWGTALQEGNRINVHFQFLDLIERKPATGRFGGDEKSLRAVAHRLGNEVVRYVTGEKGVLDTRIAFLSTQTGNKEIYAIDFDGHNSTQITSNGSINLSPAWSPDGKTIAFTCFKRRNPDLYLVDVESRSQQLFLSVAGLNAAPAWSPDGRQLALMMRKGEGSSIFLVSRDGSNRVQLTESGHNEASPTWSPEGQRLAFVSDRTGSPQIYIMDLSTKKTSRLTFNGSYNAGPAWSPRGDRIAYCGRAGGGGFDIFTIKADGSENLMLTSGAGSNEDPAWSPDGRYIAFSSTRKGNPHIFIMNAFGTNQRQLTNYEGGETHPTWSPRTE